ncbi:single-stranded DNA-binding protein [Tissierella sp. P1]|uniref:single-stranded DNA-binding protein n=1 Tax=Tissierella sp. P1 TaxID=1280483 RepID=UPI000BA1794F|nr:single-stranded DNA-binding protein [Tissierella sp. P1]OZV12308.1 single-stranded DNA-binding protein [Tissierella sp. P1]
MNNVVLIGRLTRDPELRYLPGNGTAVAKFGLAVNRDLSKAKKEEMESKGQPTADFINITVWGKTAESAANFLVKGRLVGIQGRIQTGSYEKDGVRVYTTEVVATNVEFLEWGDSNKSQSNNDSSFDFSGIEGFHPTDSDDIPF